MHTSEAITTVVLVHGAFQNGAATWQKVRPLLEAQGHRVVVVNLPGRDGDGTNPAALTLDLYRDAVLRVLADEPQPVLLVGHSFGGMTISAVAEAMPDKIRALVYLSAYLPQDGQSLMNLAMNDRDSHLGKPGNLVLAADYSTAKVSPEAAADVFANDATDADRATIVASLISEGIAPQNQPVKLTAENFGRVPKFYVETTRDHCVSPFLQERMIASAGAVTVTKIDAGHASYVTQPTAVAEAILAAATA